MVFIILAQQRLKQFICVRFRHPSEGGPARIFNNIISLWSELWVKLKKLPDYCTWNKEKKTDIGWLLATITITNAEAWINSVTKNQQECIPVGCVPPAAVAVLGGSPPGTPPGPGTPLDQASPDQAPPHTWQPPRNQATPPGADPPRTRHPHPVDRITDACENITLPQLRCGR